MNQAPLTELIARSVKTTVAECKRTQKVTNRSRDPIISQMMSSHYASGGLYSMRV